MTSPIRELIKELGRALGLEELLSDAEDLALLHFEDAPAISLSVLDDECVALAASIGTMPEGRPDVLEELLASNLLWRDTDGATLSMERYTREVFLARQMSAQALDGSAALTRALETFIDEARQWTDVFATLITTDPPGDAAASIRPDFPGQRI